MLEKDAPQHLLLASNPDLSDENIGIPEDHIQQIADMVLEDDSDGTWPEMAAMIARDEFGYDERTSEQVARFVALELAERSTNGMLDSVETSTAEMAAMGERHRERIFGQIVPSNDGVRANLTSDFPPAA